MMSGERKPTYGVPRELAATRDSGPTTSYSMTRGQVRHDIRLEHIITSELP